MSQRYLHQEAKNINILTVVSVVPRLVAVYVPGMDIVTSTYQKLKWGSPWSPRRILYCTV